VIDKSNCGRRGRGQSVRAVQRPAIPTDALVQQISSRMFWPRSIVRGTLPRVTASVFVSQSSDHACTHNMQQSFCCVARQVMALALDAILAL
jgi:hypothetical protein